MIKLRRKYLIMISILIPLQFACQVIGPGDSNYGNFTVDQNVSATMRLATIPEGYTVFTSLGVAYRHYRPKKTWGEARKSCMTDGGNLAVLDSSEKITAAKQLIDRGFDPWVGIHRLFDGAWTSVKTGLVPSPSIPWKAPLNNNIEEWNCAYCSGNKDGLRAYNCSIPLSYFCEISLIETNGGNGLLTLTLD